jgi:hypothetical protein
MERILDFIKLSYEKRAMDYHISKDKYEKTDMLLKNHKDMTTAEISNHLTFILGYPIDSWQIENFFKSYKDPILALKLYKKCHLIVEKKEKVIKKYESYDQNKVLVVSMLIFAFIFFYCGFSMLFSQPFLIDLFQNAYAFYLVTFIFSGMLFWLTLDSIVKNDLANKFENLEKIN